MHSILKMFALFIIIGQSVVFGATPPVPIHPPGHVVDLADLIDPSTESNLGRLLSDLEQKTTVQMVILTIRSLDQDEIQSFSLATAEQWQLGQREKDNGLLLVIALDDRKYRFEVGYGLEATLPDSLIGSIGRSSLVPYFKRGEYSDGISSATRAVLDRLANEYQVSFSGLELLPQPFYTGKKDPSLVLLFIFVFMIFLILFIRRLNRKYRKMGSASGPVIFPTSGHGWSGGGGFGGGFRGGGGGFGGGGSSGSW